MKETNSESMQRLSSALNARRELALSSMYLLLEGIKNNEPNSIVMSLRSLGVTDEDALIVKMSSINAAVHKLIEDFRNALEITEDGGLPRAATKLEEVIQMSFQATDNTLEICEKNAFTIRDQKNDLKNLEDLLRSSSAEIPGEAFSLLNQLKERSNTMQLANHNVVMAQSFQDISGQALQSAIRLLKELEKQLIALTIACTDDTEIYAAIEHVNNRLLMSCNQEEIDSWLHSQEGKVAVNE